ncbi:MAG: hypothetical protein IPI58_04350 [Alphaproteobacteria bacterium]|nr:MAG: hypothetical protein IPI58_04350 [Alphaproteobacteria bacterium]
MNKRREKQAERAYLEDLLELMQAAYYGNERPDKDSGEYWTIYRRGAVDMIGNCGTVMGAKLSPESGHDELIVVARNRGTREHKETHLYFFTVPEIMRGKYDDQHMSYASVVHPPGNRVHVNVLMIHGWNTQDGRTISETEQKRLHAMALVVSSYVLTMPPPNANAHPDRHLAVGHEGTARPAPH